MLHIPTQAIVIFLVLLILGLKHCKERQVSIKVLVIFPVAIAYLGFMSIRVMSLPLLALMLATVLFGGLLGYLNVRNKRTSVDRENKLIALPAEPGMLVYLMTIFAVKYFIGYATAVHMPIIETDSFYVFTHGLTGLLVGYCIGRNGFYAYQCLSESGEARRV